VSSRRAPRARYHLFITVPRLLLLLVLLPPLSGGPIEFGQAELRRALAERGLKPDRVAVLTEYSMVLPHDGYSILGNIVRGGSQRGLMYGLLEAASQIRQRGYLTAAKGEPATSVRAVRWVLRRADQDEAWFDDAELWRGLFETLGRERLNRFHLVFREPLTVMLADWVRPPKQAGASDGAAEQRRELRLAALRQIARTAADYGVDFGVGFWSDTPAGDAAFVRAALPMWIAACPALRSIELSNEATGETVVETLNHVGRLVQLDLRTRQLDAKLLASAVESKIPLRLAVPFNGERFGPPFPPFRAARGESFDNYLENPGVPDRPRPWQLYWEVWGAAEADSAYARRAVATFGISGGAGFEIDTPHIGPEWQRDGPLYKLWGHAGYAPEPANIGAAAVTTDHVAPKVAWAGKPLVLSLRVWPQTGLTRIKLHYRALNQLAEWKTLEAPVANCVFTIPAADVDARWDIQYWFELTATRAWPDASMTTPYYVVPVRVETPPPPPPEPGAE
jgi:hypothetical protein